MSKLDAPQKDNLIDPQVDTHFALKAAGLGVWEMVPATKHIRWDTQCQEMLGLENQPGMPYEDWLTLIHPEDVDHVIQALERTLDPQQQEPYSVTVRIIEKNKGEIRWIRLSGRALFSPDGTVLRLAGVAQEITQEVEDRRRIETAQRQIFESFANSPVGIALISRHELTFQMANPFYGELVGRLPEDIVGKPLLEALPEIYNQGFDNLLNEVIATGVPYVAKEVAVTLLRNQQLETIYVDLTYQPQWEVEAKHEVEFISGVLVVATDVTQQVRSRKEVEANEQRLRSIIATAPAAMGLFVGRDLIVELPNQAFIDIVGKGPNIVGKPLREVMPELDNQPFLKILDDVFTSGVMFQSDASQVNIVQHGVMTYNYYNITYTPLLDSKGEVYAILDIAIDITELIKARKKIEETQASYQAVIELAELGTWKLDFTTGKAEYSDRLRMWCGFEEGEEVTLENSYQLLSLEDQIQFEMALENAKKPENDGRCDFEISVTARNTGQKRILHSQGKVTFDEYGEPIRFTGSSQDITLQRKLQLALEHQVQERTEELAQLNEELMVTNEELASSNNKLLEANQLLLRSNENLEQFAYIASHDLQEPLRKIQLFSSLLKQRYGEMLGAEQSHLDRIQSAVSRMTLLIKDLLTFSRISNWQADRQQVNLNTIVKQSLENLSLTIEETKTTIELDPMPTIQGDASQLEQLFQNLLSNAIKFSSKDHAGNPHIPHIRILYRKVNSTDEFPDVQHTALPTECHEITVIDNGIGFDEQYANRIFTVFQRLHGKNEFAGTGIGLAICQKVVSNHGGLIKASSKPGEGASFCVYLPIQ